MCSIIGERPTILARLHLISLARMPVFVIANGSRIHKADTERHGHFMLVSQVLLGPPGLSDCLFREKSGTVLGAALRLPVAISIVRHFPCSDYAFARPCC